MHKQSEGGDFVDSPSPNSRSLGPYNLDLPFWGLYHGQGHIESVLRLVNYSCVAETLTIPKVCLSVT